jgi:F0F1-type ATP synthase assembly protein I
MKLTTGLAAVVAFTIVAALGMFTFLIYTERETTPLASLVINLVGLAIGFASLYAKAGQVQKVAEEVKNNVNGRMTQLIANVAAADAVTSERAQVAVDAHSAAGGQRQI